METRRFEKRPADVRVFEYDFRDFREFQGASPETIQSATVTVEPAGELAATVPSISGTKVQTQVTAGVSGKNYMLHFRATTNLSHIVEGEWIIAVVQPIP